MRFACRLIVFLCLAFPGLICVQAQTYLDPLDFDDRRWVVDDQIDIHITDREVVGIRGGVSIHRVNLGLREEVSWKEARGHIGAVLTDRRLLVLSFTSPGWRSRALRLEEGADPRSPDVMISDFMVLAVTPRRIILYDGLANDWAKRNIPLHDQLEATVLENFVAAVITGKRIYGVAARRGRFVEEQFRPDESFLSVSSRAHSITVRTNKRLLIFRSRSPFWDSTNLD
jgi:hypothetical protein